MLHCSGLGAFATDPEKQLGGSRLCLLAAQERYRFEPDDEWGPGYDYDVFDCVKDRMLADRELALAAVQTHGARVDRLPLWLQADREIAMVALRTHAPNTRWHCLSEDFWDDREFVRQVVDRAGRGDLIRYASASVRADRDIGHLSVLNSAGNALRYLAEELRSDAEVAWTSLKLLHHSVWHQKESSRSFKACTQYVGQSLLSDATFVAEMVRLNWQWLQYLNGEMQTNLAVVYAALDESGFALEFVPESIRRDKAVVAHALASGCTCCSDGQHRNGWTQIADFVHKDAVEVWSDRELVMALIRQRGRMLKFASPELRADRNVALASDSVKFASPSLWSDRRFILSVALTRKICLDWVAQELRTDPEIVGVAGADPC